METNTLTDVNGNVRRWYMEDDHIKRLEKLASNGESLSAAARELGIDRKTLVRGAKKRGLEAWLKEKFPPMKRRPAIRPKQSSENLYKLHMQALTAAWR